MDLDMARYREEREDFWMKEMRAVYPYGLCKKVKHKGTPTDAPTGVLFPPLPRHGERGKRLTARTRNVLGQSTMNQSCLSTYRQ